VGCDVKKRSSVKEKEKRHPHCGLVRPRLQGIAEAGQDACQVTELKKTAKIAKAVQK